MHGPILVPLDFSPLSDRALDLATAWAPAAGGTLQLVHLLEAPFEPWESAREQLVLRAGRVGDRGLQCTSRIVDRAQETRISDIARSVGAALVVMGTHGRTGWERAVLGSQAEHTLRNAPCPVVTIAPGASCPAAPQTVVVGLDFSPASLAATSAVRELGATGHWILVHAATGPPDPSARRDTRREALPVPDRGDIDARLEPLVAELRRGGGQVDIRVQNHGAAPLILEIAERERADLIALGTHARSGLVRALLGSVAADVVRRAPCPVLVAQEHA